jgi:hypothetical protein
MTKFPTDAELEFDARAQRLADAMIDVIADGDTPATVMTALGLVLSRLASALEQDEAGSGKALLRAFSGAWAKTLSRLDH